MNKARILIAEDDPNFGLVLKSYLSLQQYEVTLCEDGNKALSALQQQDFELCILDVMMPYRDGFSVAQHIQKSGRSIPVVFLTAKALKEDQIKGYRLGAIDYLIKPFDPEILLLKVEAILRRSNHLQEVINQYRIGEFVFNPHLRQLSNAETQWKLSPKENSLLALLCQKKGTVLLREEALLKIWGDDNFFTAQSMNVYISKLRSYFRTIEEPPVSIENLHGKGFIITPAAEMEE
jgi:DNA-binding response OmpR family regulator